MGKGEIVSYWRPVDSRTLGDEKVRALSAPAPNARDLWLHLLIRPGHELPGLQAGGVLTLADELGWPVEGTRAAFEEILSAGLAEFDSEARVIFLPKAMRLRISDGPKPQSPNVIRGWRKPFSQVPDSPLKAKWLATVLTGAEALGEAFTKAFAETFGEALAHPSPITQGQGQGRKKETPTALELPTARADHDQAEARAHERKRAYAKAMDRERRAQRLAVEARTRPPSDLVPGSAALSEALPQQPRDGPPG